MIKQTVALILALLAFPLIADDEPRLCPACGREATQTASYCSSCGEALKSPPSVSTANLPKESDKSTTALTPLEALAWNAIKEDVAAARTSKPALAIHHYRNALALLPLLRPETIPQNTRQSIQSAQSDALARIRQTTISCSTCRGSGRQTLSKNDARMSNPKSTLFKDVSEPSRQTTAPCPDCHGSGRKHARLPLSIALAAVSSMQVSYAQAQTLAKRTKICRTWVPFDLASLLDLHQKATIGRAIPAICPHCNGAASGVCSKCQGSGQGVCRASGCQDGFLVERKASRKRQHLKIGEMEQARPRCPACKGSGKVSCFACSGQGQIPCRRCKATGTTAPCRKCAGASGILTCSRCRGSGVYKDKVCSECEGRKEVLCPACQGGGCQPQ